jgi:hypothetical protein
MSVAGWASIRTTPQSITKNQEYQLKGRFLLALFSLLYFGIRRFFSKSKISSLLKKTDYADRSKTPRCKAPEIPRSEAYRPVRRNDEK